MPLRLEFDRVYTIYCKLFIKGKCHIYHSIKLEVRYYVRNMHFTKIVDKKTDYSK